MNKFLERAYNLPPLKHSQPPKTNRWNWLNCSYQNPNDGINTPQQKLLHVTDDKIFDITLSFIENMGSGLIGIVSTATLVTATAPLFVGLGYAGAAWCIGRSLYNLKQLGNANEEKRGLLRCERALLNKIAHIIPLKRQTVQGNTAQHTYRHSVGYDMGASKIMSISGFGTSNAGAWSRNDRSSRNFATIAPGGSHVSVFGLGGPVVGTKSH